MYSRNEVTDVGRKVSTCICRNRSGTIEVLSDVYIATGLAAGRVLNVALFWDTFNAESRINGSLGIDGRRQNKEEYGSGEEFGEHLNKQ
jgi:hypothetical protein